MVSGAFKYVPLTSSDDLCLLFCIYQSSMHRFYDALPGDTWLVNATEFGHADCLDETYASGIEVIHIGMQSWSGTNFSASPRHRVTASGDLELLPDPRKNGPSCGVNNNATDPSPGDCPSTAALSPVDATT